MNKHTRILIFSAVALIFSASASVYYFSQLGGQKKDSKAITKATSAVVAKPGEKNSKPADNNSKAQQNTNSNTSNSTEGTNDTNNSPYVNVASLVNNVDVNKMNSLSNVKKSWYFMKHADNTIPDSPAESKNWITPYNAYYVGDTSRKVIYLTFDEGYEAGYTPKLLDALKANNVHASFFMTQPYIKSSPDNVKRIVAEGHLAANHSVRHLSMPSITDPKKFNDEFAGVEQAFNQLTGKNISKFFRPPMGEYSERSLYLTNTFGYKSVFWSFAYEDWDPNKQPDPTKAETSILKSVHNGAVILLHPESKTNAEILDDLLKKLIAQGYEFDTLDKLPAKS